MEIFSIIILSKMRKGYFYDKHDSFSQLWPPLPSNGSLIMDPGQVTYKGSKILPQFVVGSVGFAMQKDHSQLSAEIVLHRIISYHLTNTYIPTIR
jgi:hypothetical protein